MADNDKPASGESAETPGKDLEADNRELRRLQRQLEQYRDRYIDLYDFAPLGYVTLDEDGYIQEINLAGAKMLAVDRDGLIGYPLVDYVLPEDRGALFEHLRRCRRQRRLTVSEVTLEAKDQRRITVQLHSIPVAEENSISVFCKTAMTDVTDRKRAEEQLKALNETLEHRVAQRAAEAVQRADQLRVLASQLGQAEQRERFRLAHLLGDHLLLMLLAARNELSQLAGHVRQPEAQPMVDRLGMILEESIAEMHSLREELSPSALYESGLGEALRWLAGHMEQKHGLKVEVRADPDAEPAEEPIRVFLFQAARELLENVVVHAETDRAWISMRRISDAELEIEIRDSGTGFDPRKIRVPDAADGGVFGLFSIRERLDVFGGRLEIHSAPGKGSRMVMTAPLRQPRPAMPLIALARSQSGAVPDASSQPAPDSTDESTEVPVFGVTRVLLADDHPVIRKALAQLLSHRPDIQVVGEAGNGEQAVDMAFQLHPDVVLMDVVMPKLSGIDATRRIKAHLPEIRVIGLSMYDEGEIPNAMREAGVEAYIPKTASADVLIDAVLAPQAR